LRKSGGAARWRAWRAPLYIEDFINEEVRNGSETDSVLGSSDFDGMGVDGEDRFDVLLPVLCRSHA